MNELTEADGVVLPAGSGMCVWWSGFMGWATEKFSAVGEMKSSPSNF